MEINTDLYSKNLFYNAIDNSRQAVRFKFQMTRILNSIVSNIEDDEIDDAKHQASLLLGSFNIEKLNDAFSIEFYRIVEFIDRKLGDNSFPKKKDLITTIKNLTKIF